MWIFNNIEGKKIHRKSSDPCIIQNESEVSLAPSRKWRNHWLFLSLFFKKWEVYWGIFFLLEYLWLFEAESSFVHFFKFSNHNILIESSLADRASLMLGARDILWAIAPRGMFATVMINKWVHVFPRKNKSLRKKATENIYPLSNGKTTKHLKQHVSSNADNSSAFFRKPRWTPFIVRRRATQKLYLHGATLADQAWAFPSPC